MLFEILTGVVIVVSTIIAIKFAKGLFKLIFLITLVLSLLIVGFGVLVLKDSIEFKSAMQTEDLLFLGYANDEVITGVITLNGLSNFTFVDDLKIAEYNAYFKQEDYASLKNGYYKVFLINIDSLGESGNIQYSESSPNKTMDAEKIVSALKSETPREDFADGLLEDATEEEKSNPEIFKQQQMDTLGTDSEFKGRAFMMLFSKAMEDQGQLMIVNKFKSGDMTIYPEGTMFKTLNVIPSGYINDIWKNNDID